MKLLGFVPAIILVAVVVYDSIKDEDFRIIVVVWLLTLGCVALIVGGIFWALS